MPRLIEVQQTDDPSGLERALFVLQRAFHRTRERQLPREEQWPHLLREVPIGWLVGVGESCHAVGEGRGHALRPAGEYLITVSRCLYDGDPAAETYRELSPEEWQHGGFAVGCCLILELMRRTRLFATVRLPRDPWCFGQEPIEIGGPHLGTLRFIASFALEMEPLTLPVPSPGFLERARERIDQAFEKAARTLDEPDPFQPPGPHTSLRGYTD